jgi:mRNA interferase MazF
VADVALSTRTDKVYPSEAVVTVGDEQNKAMADQLTTAAKERLLNRAGKLAPAHLRAVEEAVRLQLGLG